MRRRDESGVASLRSALNPSLSRVAAVGLGIASLACASTRVIPLWNSFDATLRANHASLSERDVLSLQTIISPSCLLAAARMIPVTAKFGVVVGDVPPTPDVLKMAVPRLFQYWLLPRPYAGEGNPHAARWIVTYHESSELLGVRVVRETGLCADANVVEVRGS